MKFFWKIFFSTILITSVAFSIGGYSLISFQFTTALEREIDASYAENNLLRNVFFANSQMRDVIFVFEGSRYPESDFMYPTDPAEMKYTEKTDAAPESKRALPTDNQIYLAARAVAGSTNNPSTAYRFSDSAFQTIYSNTPLHSAAVIERLPEKTKGHMIFESDGQYYINTAVPLEESGALLYLENYRNITFLFDNRAIQYQNFFRMMLVMVSISGIVTLLISNWLTRPLTKLSRAAKQISNGDFSQRLIVRSRDEVGKLSEDFNSMAIHIEQMVAELKEASRRQEDFSASFAHEIKTPLTSIIGYADMLRSKKMEPEQAMISADYIFREGKRLEELSMKLLEMIVLEKQDFNLKPVRAAAFFSAVEDVMRPLLQKENITLHVSAQNALLPLEPDLMKTVLINLIDNAQKAIDRDGEIFLTGSWVDRDYIITVRDTGKGIDSRDISKITEAFYMVDKSRSRARGSVGLGLSLCNSILKCHNARMEFESVPGAGTCVTIYLNGVEEE